MREYFRTKGVLVFDWDTGLQATEVRYCNSQSHVWHFINWHTSEDVTDDAPCDGSCRMGPEDREIPVEHDIAELVEG